MKKQTQGCDAYAQMLEQRPEDMTNWQRTQVNFSTFYEGKFGVLCYIFMTSCHYNLFDGLLGFINKQNERNKSNQEKKYTNMLVLRKPKLLEEIVRILFNLYSTLCIYLFRFKLIYYMLLIAIVRRDWKCPTSTAYHTLERMGLLQFLLWDYYQML